MLYVVIYINPPRALQHVVIYDSYNHATYVRTPKQWTELRLAVKFLQRGSDKTLL